MELDSQKPTNLRKPTIVCACRRPAVATLVRAVSESVDARLVTSRDLGNAMRLTLGTGQGACVVTDHTVKDFRFGVLETSITPQGSDAAGGGTRVPLLAVLDPGDLQSAFAAAAMGALAALPSTLSSDELEAHVRAAIEVGVVTSEQDFRDHLFSQAPFKSLTKRERQVLLLLMEGEQNKRVAVALDVSLRTVESARASLLCKLNVATVVEMVRTVTLAQADRVTFMRSVYADLMLACYSKSPGRYPAKHNAAA